jgi:hypothetical protein
MEKFSKLASLGAFGVAGGTVALYLFLVFVAFHPTLTSGSPGATGGIDHVGWRLVTVAMLVPVGILAGAHAALGKQLKDGPKPMHQ